MHIRLKLRTSNNSTNRHSQLLTHPNIKSHVSNPYSINVENTQNVTIAMKLLNVTIQEVECSQCIVIAFLTMKQENSSLKIKTKKVLLLQEIFYLTKTSLYFFT